MKLCPICERPEYIVLVNVCPICGAKGTKPETDALCIEYIEWYLDRSEDLRVFGTPFPPTN